MYFCQHMFSACVNMQYGGIWRQECAQEVCRCQHPQCPGQCCISSMSTITIFRALILACPTHCRQINVPTICRVPVTETMLHKLADLACPTHCMQIQCPHNLQSPSNWDYAAQASTHGRILHAQHTLGKTMSPQSAESQYASTHERTCMLNTHCRQVTICRVLNRWVP